MNCVEEVRHSKIRVAENGRKAIILNPSNDPHSKIQIDNCVITAGQRCDWAINRDGIGTIFIELKGCNVSHAIEQLFATVVRHEVAEFVRGRVGFLVVCSQIPRFGSHVAKAKARAARQYRAGFHVVKNRCEFRLDDILAIRE